MNAPADAPITGRPLITIVPCMHPWHPQHTRQYAVHPPQWSLVRAAVEIGGYDAVDFTTDHTAIFPYFKWKHGAGDLIANRHEPIAVVYLALIDWVEDARFEPYERIKQQRGFARIVVRLNGESVLDVGLTTRGGTYYEDTSLKEAVRICRAHADNLGEWARNGGAA